MLDRRRFRARDLASAVRWRPTPPPRTSTASTLGPTPRRPRLLCRLEAPVGDGGEGKCRGWRRRTRRVSSAAFIFLPLGVAPDCCAVWKHRVATMIPSRAGANHDMTILGKVIEILDQRGELENLGWMFMGQANKEAGGTLRGRMDATTSGYWAQEEWLLGTTDNTNLALMGRENSMGGRWSDDDG